MNTRIAVAALVALAFPLTACSNADDEAAAKAVSQDLQKGGEGDLELSQKDADCIGEGMVDEVGRDQLIEYKIITKDNKPDDGKAADMSKDDAESTADVFQDCTDVKKIFLDEMSSAPEESKSCMDDKLTDDVIHDFLVAGFQGDDANKVLEDAVGECMQAS